jgi:hypothetical protein
MHLLGREVILALPIGGTKTGPARLGKDHAALVSRLASEVIAVVPDIRSYERRQLVQKRLPFLGKRVVHELGIQQVRRNPPEADKASAVQRGAQKDNPYPIHTPLGRAPRHQAISR